MAKTTPFVERMVARLAPLGPVRARAMFGGHGVYLDDLMFGLIAWDRLFLKVDDATIATFRDAGGAPFPHRIELDFVSYRGSALLELRDAELNPALDPSWFRLKAARSSRTPEEARP